MTRAERHQPDETPQNLGRYRIRGLLAEGGMGRLYVAEQNGIQGFAKIVAVKRILPHLASSEHFRTLFLNEARVAARLEHPNIVATYELGEAEGSYFIAMEYLPGEDLSAILGRCHASGPMPVEFAAFLAQQCANGLHYAHELRDSLGRPSGLVHRDVNPSNIVVTYHGALKLLDFGVVKATAAPNRTIPGAFKGKYAYCAPEQLSNDGVDPRTDVFSLGIVLWECLTGSRLFAGASDADTIDAVRSQTIVPPAHIRADVPLELNHLTMRALFRDRQHRHASAAEMSEALDRFLSQAPQRPTGKKVGQWLEGLFGPERAALKRMIAQGGDIEQALVMLAQTDESGGRRDSTGPEKLPSGVRLRPLWSTGFEPSNPGRGTRAPTPPRQPVTLGPRVEPSQLTPVIVQPVPPLRSPRPALIGLGAGLAAAAAFTLIFQLRQRPEVVPATSDQGALRIESTPGGAHIFVDGDPSGLTTPAVLRHLQPGRTVELRLVKAGYATEARKIAVESGPSAQTFALREATGTVRLEGVPAGATLYVDDVRMERLQPFTVAVGTHRVRIEDDSDVIFSNSVEVRPGEQSLRIHAERRPR
jgi:serine/threonine protein kinase